MTEQPAPTPADLAQLIRQHLDTIATYWPDTATPMNHGHGTSGAGSPLPASTITLRADTTLTLAWWVHAALDQWPVTLAPTRQRQVPIPTLTHTTTWATIDEPGTLDCTDVPAMCAWLRQYAHILAGWDTYGTTLEAELQPLAAHTRAVSRPPRHDRLDLGPCPDCGHAILAKAPTWVRLPVPTSDPRLLAPWTPWQPRSDQPITCHGCHRKETLLGWHKAIVGAQRLLSADELVEQIHAHFGMRYSPVTVRVWQRRGLVESRGHAKDGRTLYDRVQVFAALMDRERLRGDQRGA